MDYEKKYKEMKARVLEMGRGYVKGLDYSKPRQIAEYIDPELKESEDERIREAIIKCLKWLRDEARWTDVYGSSFDSIFSWLEKQGEHANFLSKIQVGDKVTRNEDGVLVNLSQLKRVAKPAEKQGNINPTEDELEALRMAAYEPTKNWSEKLQSLYEKLTHCEQGKQKSANKEYTFKVIPRLLGMIQPTDRAKSYCQKLIDSLEQEGYSTDAKIVRDCLKQMNGEKLLWLLWMSRSLLGVKRMKTFSDVP